MWGEGRGGAHQHADDGDQRDELRQAKEGEEEPAEHADGAR